MISSAVEPQSARDKSLASMRHHGYQIDIVVAHGLRDLRRRFAFDNYRFNFKPIEQRIGQQVSHLGAQLQQPMIVLFCENPFRQRQQIGRDTSRSAR